MARKPPDRRQLPLFPPNPADSLEPQDKLSYKQEGDHNAVQDDHPRTPATTTGDARPAPQEPEAAPDTGNLRARAEDQPRNLDRNSLPGEIGQRPEPDRERSTGDGSQGNGGAFGFRVSAQRERTAFPGRSNGVRPPSHVARLKASRNQPSFFDSLFDPSPATPPPPGALNGGTV